MPIWGNFKIAIFSSIYSTFSHFCVVFSDHVLQARGRAGDGSGSPLPRGQPGPPIPRLPTQQESRQRRTQHSHASVMRFRKCISKVSADPESQDKK